jgi:DeoR/GlpR family transcriptional regulator of sugar metabolism
MTQRGRHPAGRRLAIQRKLLLDGTATVESLAMDLDVSVATIRRDLGQMENEGLVRRTHGGATIRAPRGADQAFEIREQTDGEAKRLIARAACTLVEPDQTILMNDGSTVLALARELVAAQMPLTVATPGVNVATALSECAGIDAYLLGGRVRHQTLGTSGHFAETMLRTFNADIAFIAAEGFSRAEGLTFSYESDASLARLMRERSSTAVVLATARKLQQRDRITALEPSRVDMLVTDCDDEAILAPIEACGVRVLRAASLPSSNPLAESVA